MLCLSNGYRIQVNDDFKTIFEVSNLDNVSPATVTRCGMIFIDDNQLGMKTLLDTFLKKFITNFSEQEIEDCKNVFEKLTNRLPYL